MPFGARTVATRTDINEIYQGNAQNILEKASVSNMVGLLQQMNEISKYASEVFGTLLQDAERNLERINNCKQRLNKIDQAVPNVESMFVQNSPAYFYDNPYSGREYSRRDNLRGLIFRRDRASAEVNRRRNQAEPPPDFSSMDVYSENNVPCIKKYTDSNFFMNQWLEAEKQKMEEDRKRRQIKKENKKKKKQMKRQATKVIMKVQKNKYNALGAEFNTDAKSDEPQFAEVKQYALDGENPALDGNTSGGGEDNTKEKSPRPSNNNIKKQPPPSQQQQQQQNLGGDIQKQHIPQASYVPQDNNKAIPSKQQQQQQQQQNNEDDGDDEEDDNKEAKDKESRNDINFDEDANDEENNNRPGNGEDEGEVYLSSNNRVPPPPSNINQGNGGPQQPPPPPNPYAEDQPYFSEPVEAKPVPQRPKPMLPSRGVNFLDAIKTGIQLKQAEPVKREVPQDARSQLLTSISQGKALKHVDKEVPKPKEEVANASIYAVLQRRKFIEDSESDDSDGSDDWGSEED